MKQISRSTTPQRCSIGLRCGECRGHWSTVHFNISETSLKYYELCDMVHYTAGNVHHKMSTLWSSSSSDRLWHLNDAQLNLTGPMCAKKISPTHYTTTSSLNRWYTAGWINAFMLFMPISDPTIWMLQLKLKLCQIRQRFSNLLLSSFDEHVWIVVLLSCS